MKAKEPQKAIDFYSAVFGWEFKKWDSPGMDYWLISTGDEKTPGIDGGLAPGDPVKPPVNTIGVKDLNAAIEKVKQHGGKILSPRMPIPGVGWFASFEDPSGNQFGLEQDDPAAR
jgi:predicted enzyme related to lactoylglutathione lyase